MPLVGELVLEAQKTFTTRSVAWTTGSERSPPGGETEPTTVTEPASLALVGRRDRACDLAGALVERGELVPR